MSHIKTEKSSKWRFQRTRGNKHKERDGEGTRTATDRQGQQFRPTSRSTQLQNQKFKINMFSEKASMITHHYQTQFYHHQKLHFSTPTTAQTYSKLISCHITNLAITLNQPNTTQLH
jgi:hypothetical protein